MAKLAFFCPFITMPCDRDTFWSGSHADWNWLDGWRNLPVLHIYHPPLWQRNLLFGESCQLEHFLLGVSYRLAYLVIGWIHASWEPFCLAESHRLRHLLRSLGRWVIIRWAFPFNLKLPTGLYFVQDKQQISIILKCFILWITFL